MPYYTTSRTTHSKEIKKKIRQRQAGKFETGIERKVEWVLRQLRVEYQQEKAIRGVGLVDFYLPAYRLVVECDGDYWHNLPGAKWKDMRRDATLRKRGIEVLRLTEHDINSNLRGCFAAIKDKIRER